MRARTELAWRRLAAGDAEGARVSAETALARIAGCGNHIDEPDALAVHAVALQRLGLEGGDAADARWRRLVDAIGAAGLRARIERNLRSVG